MNDKQKIFVMVGVGSLVILFVSITLLEWTLSQPLSIMSKGVSRSGEIFGEMKTNWLGIICIFNTVVSLVGFKLFKD